MKVQVYVYDLTRGMASALSPMLLGSRIEGVWHTGVVIDGREEIFFGYGISRTRAGTTMFGQPHHILDIGTTEVPKEMLSDLISDLSPRFMPEHYNLIFHNCNTFSNELCQLLTGEGLPEYIMNQAEVLFNTPFGEQIMPMVLAMEGITGRATATGLEQTARSAAQPAPPALLQTASASAASSRSAAAAAAAAASAVTSAAANAGMEATVQVAEEVAAAAATAGGSSCNAEEEHKAAVAAAGMAAAERAAAAAAGSTAVQGSSTGVEAATTAVGKVTEGVEALHITADSSTAAS